MRKISILLLVILSLGFYLSQSIAAEKIDLKLKDQIGIVFLNRNMLFVISDDGSTLLALNKDKVDNIKKFHYRDLNVITLNNNYLDIRSKQRIVLNDTYTSNGVLYTMENGLIYITYKNTNVCIYMHGNPNINACQFVYFYNTNISHLNICDYNEIVIYYYKNALPYKILEDIYEQAIDTYPLRDDELTILKLSDNDYDFIVIDNE